MHGMTRRTGQIAQSDRRIVLLCSKNIFEITARLLQPKSSLIAHKSLKVTRGFTSGANNLLRTEDKKNLLSIVKCMNYNDFLSAKLERGFP